MSTLPAASEPWSAGLPAALSDSLRGSKIPCLDGMRAIAAWSVVAYHVGAPFGFGSQAVEFFFVLSGFLITWLLLKEEDRFGAVSLKGFYIRRSLRIFPPFYAYWLVSIAMMTAAHWAIPWGVMWASFFYVSNWYQAFYGAISSPVSHCWSLGLEEQYYLLWPVAFVLLRRRGASRLRWTGVAILLIWLRRLQCMWMPDSDDYVYHAFDTRADQVLIGTWTAIALRDGHLRGLCRFLASSAWWILVTIALLFAQFSQDDRVDWLGLRGMGFMVEPALFTVLILQVLSHPRKAGLRWLDWRVMLHLGALSYSTYLWHQLAVGGARHRLMHLDPVLRVSLTILLVLVASHASYYLVELPALRLKDRLARSAHAG
jgi:peptidoglycan/LPS O-acetylase OafA/YrhL